MQKEEVRSEKCGDDRSSAEVGPCSSGAKADGRVLSGLNAIGSRMVQRTDILRMD